MSKDNSGPAFPATEAHGLNSGYSGMTLRDYFAANVNIGSYNPVETFKREHGRYPSVGDLAEYIADIRYIEADAMLKARGHD